MFNSRSNNLRLLKLLGVFILIVFIVSFALFKSLNYFKGPEIIITKPYHGETIYSPTIEISGQALRITKIYMNGQPISVDEKGNWNEKVAIFEGLNIITIRVEDQFNRKIQKELNIVGQLRQ